MCMYVCSIIVLYFAVLLFRVSGIAVVCTEREGREYVYVCMYICLHKCSPINE